MTTIAPNPHTVQQPGLQNGELKLADLPIVAANLVRWTRLQSEAAEHWPLAYVDCLLAAMRDAGGVDVGKIPDELCRLAPWLEPETSLNLVCEYLDGPRRLLLKA